MANNKRNFQQVTSPVPGAEDQEGAPSKIARVAVDALACCFVGCDAPYWELLHWPCKERCLVCRKHIIAAFQPAVAWSHLGGVEDILAQRTMSAKIPCPHCKGIKGREPGLASWDCITSFHPLAGYVSPELSVPFLRASDQAFPCHKFLSRVDGTGDHKCTMCGEQGDSKQLASHLCPKFVLACPDCATVIRPGQLADHHTNCHAVRVAKSVSNLFKALGIAEFKNNPADGIGPLDKFGGCPHAAATFALSFSEVRGVLSTPPHSLVPFRRVTRWPSFCNPMTPMPAPGCWWVQAGCIMQ